MVTSAVRARVPGSRSTLKTSGGSCLTYGSVPCAEWVKKWAFIGPCVSRTAAMRSENAHVFLSFPYVCPEPVLVK